MSRFNHKLPEVLIPEGDICVPLFIPDDPDYVALVVRQLRQLILDRKYVRDENHSALVVREQFASRMYHPFIDALASGNGCTAAMPEDSDCFEYNSYSPIVGYYPQNPFSQPDYKPQGYLTTPFTKFADFDLVGWLSSWFPDWTEGLTGYQPNDIIVDLSALPILANWESVINGVMPQITINLEGEGVIELHLLNYPLGGRAIITVDEYPNIADIFLGVLGNGIAVELNRDITSLPIEADSTSIEEVEITGAGSHFVAITFVPVIDDSSIPINFGGGFRKVVLCGFDGIGVVSGITDIRFNNCTMEYFLNGVWIEPVGFDPLCFKGDTGATGAQGLQGIQGIQGLPGADGADGLPGADGADGLPGADGADGLPGADGADGLPGADGADGLPGADGADGLPGADGTGSGAIKTSVYHELISGYIVTNSQTFVTTGISFNHDFTYENALITCYVRSQNIHASYKAFLRLNVDGTFSPESVHGKNAEREENTVVGQFAGLDTTQTVNVSLEFKADGSQVRIDDFQTVIFSIIEYGNDALPILTSPLINFDAGGDPYTLTDVNSGYVGADGYTGNCVRVDNASSQTNEFIDFDVDLGAVKNITDISFRFFGSDINNCAITLYIDGLFVAIWDYTGLNNNVWYQDTNNAINENGQLLNIRMVTPSGESIRLDDIQFTTD